MPLYEYQCQKCGKRVEILQRASDKPHKHCPNCGGDMKKLFSSPSIQFKGSGFYKTDYASKPASTGESKPDAKPDSTPAAKPDKKSSD